MSHCHEKIIKARRYRNLRTPELGELANIDLKRIIDIEMGTVKPTGDELLAIAKALETTIADMLSLPIRKINLETNEFYWDPSK